jgi:hypothetical protein
MKPLESKEIESRRQQDPPKGTSSRVLELPVIPLPTGVTRADRKRVNDVAAQILRD